MPIGMNAAAAVTVRVDGVAVGRSRDVTVSHSVDYHEFSMGQTGALGRVQAPPGPAFLRGVHFDHMRGQVQVDFAGGGTEGRATLDMEEVERATGMRWHQALHGAAGRRVTLETGPGQMDHVPAPARQHFDEWVEHPNCGPLLDEGRLREWADSGPAGASERCDELRPLERLDAEVEAVAALAR